MGPSDAFNCIYALLRSKDANIMQTKVAVESSKLVLRDLTKKYAVMHIFFHALIHVQSYIYRQIFKQCYKVEIELMVYNQKLFCMLQGLWFYVCFQIYRQTLLS